MGLVLSGRPGGPNGSDRGEPASSASDCLAYGVYRTGIRESGLCIRCCLGRVRYRFPWGDVEGFDDDGNQYWEHDLPSDYEPSEPMNIIVPDILEETKVDPVSQASWKRFAQTELVASEVRNLKQARMMSLNDSFLAESPFTSMSSMFAMSEDSLKVLTQHPESNPNSRSSEEAIQRLSYVRRVRIARSDDDLRDASLSKLKSIILLDPATTRLGELLVPVSTRQLSEVEIRRSLEQAFSKKSSNTLYKRACALSRYVDWFLLIIEVPLSD